MKFLIDNNLSPQLSNLLTELNYDAVHVRGYKMQAASDEEIFLTAFKEERIIVTADTDFGFILSKWNKNLPSVIIFRFFSTKPEIQFETIKHIVKYFKAEL